MSASDAIRKQAILNAPRERVWAAIADAGAFGAWFGVRFDGAFAPGAHMRGTVQPTQVDDDVARRQAPHAGKPFEITVVDVVPMQRFSFRWHPFAIDPAVDYSTEPTTLIAFELHDAPGGTELTITESGFDAIPLARRAEAFEANAEGWTLQLGLIERFLAAPR